MYTVTEGHLHFPITSPVSSTAQWIDNEPALTAWLEGDDDKGRVVLLPFPMPSLLSLPTPRTPPPTTVVTLP